MDLHETGTDASDSAERLVRKGRGAVSNQVGRFERFAREAIDDGWGSLDEELPALETEISADASRTVIAWNDSPDLGFDRSINPYRGCEHGCAYCYARPTHAFLGLSPGQDFESRLTAKHDAAAILEQELAKPGYRCRPIALGTNTDPYQPIEKRLRITRALLEVLAAHEHPLTITTKSALITRDLDLLTKLAEKRLVKVALSITTLDRALARRLEPRAATPERRLQALAQLAEAGIPCAVMVAPVIPALTDAEMEQILEAAAKAGARGAGYIVLRLPLEIKDLFREWLHQHAPGREKHVFSLIRSLHGGALYESAFGLRQTGKGPYADLLARRFALACERFALNEDKRPLDDTRFKRPLQRGAQLALF
jgi:DNA repair photolyase